MDEPPPTPPRAIKRRRSRAEVDRIIEQIVDLMVSCSWVTGVTEQHLAKEHQVAVSTIRDWAATASRMAFRSANHDTMNEVRASALSALGRYAALSEGKGDYRTAVQAQRERAVIAGACTPLGEGPGVASVVINIQKDPSFKRVVAIIQEALLPYPEALDALNAAFAKEAAREKRREESRALPEKATH